FQPHFCGESEDELANGDDAWTICRSSPVPLRVPRTVSVSDDVGYLVNLAWRYTEISCGSVAPFLLESRFARHQHASPVESCAGRKSPIHRSTYRSISKTDLYRSFARNSVPNGKRCRLDIS